MDQRISVITLGVVDLERARRFYEDGLGWRHAGDFLGVYFFQIAGTVFSLYPRATLTGDAGLAAAGVGVGGIALAHNVRVREDVDAVLAEAERAGATILRRAKEAAWGGYSGYFADPDGHPWEVAWNPHWPIDAEGRVSLPA